MIYFILWVVFLVVLVLSVAVAHLLESRGSRSSHVRSVADQPSLDEPLEMGEGGDPLAEAHAVESFDQLPADEFHAEGDPPVDDFAAFEEDFK